MRTSGCGEAENGQTFTWKSPDQNAPMYKKQADAIFFPAGTNILSCVFSIKNLIWPQDPRNKGKIDFLLHI